MTNSAVPVDDPSAPDFDASAHARAMVGHHYRSDDYYTVGREKVREYAKAVQDYHPAHWDEDVAKERGHAGLVAPLTFISLIGILAQRRLFESVITGYDLSQILQTDQVQEMYRPIVAGDELTCHVSLDSFRQMGGSDIIVTKSLLTDQRDEAVLASYTTLMGRSGGTVDENIAHAVEEVIMHGVSLSARTGGEDKHKTEISDEPAPEFPVAAPFAANPSFVRRFEDVSVGEELEPRTVKLTRGDLVNYAGVSGDANPIHWSDEVAKLAGLDNVVAHGMLTMGLGAGLVTSWAGDPGAVTEYSVRFTSMVKVDAHKAAAVEYSGKVKSVDPETRTAVVAISAKFEGKRIFGRATATVQLA